MFEFIMLMCFGAAWPFAVYRAYVSRRSEGTSIVFLYVVFLGYMSGILHKIFFSFDLVISLYILNAIMVFVCIVLYYRNRAYSKMMQRKRR
jgi:hypothetical protein